MLVSFILTFMCLLKARSDLFSQFLKNFGASLFQVRGCDLGLDLSAMVDVSTLFASLLVAILICGSISTQRRKSSARIKVRRPRLRARKWPVRIASYSDVRPARAITHASGTL